MQVDHVFNQGDYSTIPGVTLLFAAILFAFQIYCDFSGYSDIAIGTARLFGFNLMRNFAYPFFSRNIAEFWQRWHISLSTWFRDYVFIPLGGSRVKLSIYIRNIFVTYVLSGLWHGANWTFIIWGALHAFFYLPLLLSPTKGKHNGIVAENRFLPSAKEVLQMLITFLMFTFSMIFFRSDSVGRAFNYYHSLALNFFPDVATLYEILLSKNMIMIFLLVMVEWVQRRKQHVLHIENIGTIFRWTIYAFAIAAFIYYGQFGNQKQFIYFQF